MAFYQRLAGTLRNVLRRTRSGRSAFEVKEADSEQAVADYWTSHNVTMHRRFASASESLDYLSWRNDQYFNYIDLMPVSGEDGRVVLDYGCGPGNDLAGFAAFGSPQRLIGMDVSASSLAEAKARLDLHRSDVELHLLEPGSSRIPLPDASVDVIHCSGVLHHIPEPEETLTEFRRVLRPEGRLQLMVYNRQSLWFHLYCAYHIQILQGRYSGESLEEVFRKSTDGENCPVSRAYRPQEIIELARRAGLDVHLRGVAIAAFEMSLFETRYAAIMDLRLPAECRTFLSALELDERGLARSGAHCAGIDACFAGGLAR